MFFGEANAEEAKDPPLPQFYPVDPDTLKAFFVQWPGALLEVIPDGHACAMSHVEKFQKAQQAWKAQAKAKAKSRKLPPFFPVDPATLKTFFDQWPGALAEVMDALSKGETCVTPPTKLRPSSPCPSAKSTSAESQDLFDLFVTYFS